MKHISFEEAIHQATARDSRYDPLAYVFVREALDFTIKLLSKPATGPERHVSGAELLEGLRQYALQEFGPLSGTVLKQWGVTRCGDFGNIVFNMVEVGILGKTPEDRIEDFHDIFDFDQAFRTPFRPKRRAAGRAQPTARRVRRGQPSCPSED